MNFFAILWLYDYFSETTSVNNLPNRQAPARYLSDCEKYIVDTYTGKHRISMSFLHKQPVKEVGL